MISTKSKAKITEKTIGVFENFVEKSLWATRYVVILPIVFSLIGSILMFIIGSLDVIDIINKTIIYFTNVNHEYDLHTDVVVKVIGAIDIYLIAIVLLIFTFGIYTLFISKIDAAEKSEASKILEIHSLDNLKDKLSQVIIMALIVKFFQMISTMYKLFVTPLDMIYLSLSILGLGLCLFFLYRAKGHGSERKKHRAE